MGRWVYDPKLGKNVNGGRKAKGPVKPRLRMSFDLVGDWQKAMRVGKALKLDDAIEKAVRQESALGEKMMKQNLTRGGQPSGSPFAALSPWTIASRKLAKPAIAGSKPLIARGDLRNAITHVVTGSGRTTQGFVGVLKQARAASGGGYMVNIAAVQEFGKTIVVRLTPKMVRFLAILAKTMGGSPKKSAPGTAKKFLVIRIPPRPFIGPTFKVWAKDAPARFMKRIAILTKGALGTP